MAELHPIFQPIIGNGGLYNVSRVFNNVGTNEIHATVKGNQTETVVDVQGLGMVYSITNIRIYTIKAPTLSATITIKNNGVTIYTKTGLTAALVPIGAFIELLSAGTTMPGDQVLPATFTCTASDGSYKIIIQGLEN